MDNYLEIAGTCVGLIYFLAGIQSQYLFMDSRHSHARHLYFRVL